MTINTTRIIILIIAIGLITFVFITLFPPLGSGNINRCVYLKHDMMVMSQEALQAKYRSTFNAISCDDGELIGVCQDSHSSWLGGNMVIKTAKNTSHVYTGHVCGPQFLRILFQEFSSQKKHEGKPLLVAEFIEHINTRMTRL